MKKLLLLFGVMAMFVTTSCLSGPTSGGYSENTFSGKLVVTSLSDGQITYEDEKAQVTVTIPNAWERKMTILFQGVAFAQAMADKGAFIDLELTSIPFESSLSSVINFVFDEKDVIPTGYDNQMLINRVWGSIGTPTDIRFEMQSRGSQVRFYIEDNSTEN